MWFWIFRKNGQVIFYVNFISLFKRNIYSINVSNSNSFYFCWFRYFFPYFPIFPGPWFKVLPSVVRRQSWACHRMWNYLNYVGLIFACEFMALQCVRNFRNFFLFRVNLEPYEGDFLWRLITFFKSGVDFLHHTFRKWILYPNFNNRLGYWGAFILRACHLAFASRLYERAVRC